MLAATLASGSRFNDYDHFPVAPHLHTKFSDGDHSLADVAGMVRAAGYRAMLVSDHSDMLWSYPVLGTTVGVKLNSIREQTFEKYLEACRKEQERDTDFVIIPGVEASPYYYWSGKLTGKRLTNHQWQKHLVIMGIENPDVYRRLPLIAYGTSRFTPGFTDHGEEPYQEFVDAVHGAGGMAFWAHPLVEREERIAMHIFSKVVPYAESLLTVPNSDGMAVHRWDSVITAPGGLWDQAIRKYCAGERKLPPRAVVEIDYHRGPFPASAVLHALVPRAGANDPTTAKSAILSAIQAGRHYVVKGAGPGVLELEDFSLTDTDDRVATLGETLQASGPLTVRYSVKTENAVQCVRIIRDGAVVHETTEPAGAWTDEDIVEPGHRSYYRLAVRTKNRAFLLANPIYCEPVETVALDN